MHRKPDPYFLLPWDASHWLDLAIVELRENSLSSNFIKLIIKRSNRLHTLFGSGRGHAEYKTYSKSQGLKALETVTYATTRFSSSAFDQWKKIYNSYPALVTAYSANREDKKDDCEETKYQLRGQDFAIDLCGIIDVFQPVVSLMIKCQSLNVPPWKIVAWFPIVIDILEDIRTELKRLKDGDVVKPAEKLLPRLAKHWQELTKEEVEECSFQGIQVYEGWLVVNESEQLVEGPSTDKTGKQHKRKTITWEARSPNDCLDGLYQLTEDNPMCLASRYKNIKIDNITKLEAVFDIEGLTKLLCHFSHANGRIKVSRAGRHLWDLRGKREFADFFKYILGIFILALLCVITLSHDTLT